MNILYLLYTFVLLLKSKNLKMGVSIPPLLIICLFLYARSAVNTPCSRTVSETSNLANEEFSLKEQRPADYCVPAACITESNAAFAWHGTAVGSRL